MSLARRAEDPELGTVQQCSVCGEWWPLDEEFFYVRRHQAGDSGVSRGQAYRRASDVSSFYRRCRACWADRGASQHARRRAVS